MGLEGIGRFVFEGGTQMAADVHRHRDRRATGRSIIARRCAAESTRTAAQVWGRVWNLSDSRPTASAADRNTRGEKFEPAWVW